MKTSRADKGKGTASAVRKAWRQIWRTMVAGLLVWIPLIITVWVSWFFINKFVFGLERQFKLLFDAVNEWGKEIPGLSFLGYFQYVYGIGILFSIALFVSTGMLTRMFVGQKMIALGEKIVFVIPLVNKVYRAVQQIRDVLITRKGAVFQKVCLVEYPRPGMIAVGFITSLEQGAIQKKLGKELQAVFIATTPNPTSGYLVYLPLEDIILIDISVEDAMKIIVSAGAYAPMHEGEALDITKDIDE